MPTRFPTQEDIQLPSVQANRPVAAIDVSPYGQGTQALAKGVQNLGQGIEKGAEDINQAQIQQHTRTVENGLMDLSTSYIANRNQFGLSNDPNDIKNWQTSNEDARKRFNSAIEGVTPALAQHAAGRAGMMDAEEGFRVHEHNHTVQSSQAHADSRGDIDNLAASVVIPDDLSRPDPTREENLRGVQARIDQRRAAGLLTNDQASQFNQHAGERYHAAQTLAFVKAAQEAPPGPRKEQLYQIAETLAGGGGFRNQGGAGAGAALSAPVNDAIRNAAGRYGVDPALLSRSAQIESSGDPNSNRDKPTKYKGLFNLDPGEFAKYGPPGGDIYNANDNAMAAANKMKAEGAEFAGITGRQPSGFDHYMIHQQGVAGYAAHIANPNAPAWQNMLSTGEGRAKGEAWAKAAIWGNIPDQYKAGFGSVDNVTSRDFVGMWQAKFGAPAAAGASSSYTASQGDTLSDVADRLGTSAAALRSSNPALAHSSDDQPIAAGTQLSLPAGAAAPAAGGAPAPGPQINPHLSELGRKYLTPEKVWHFQQVIETSRRADAAAATHQQALQDKQRKDYYKGNEGQLFDAIVTGQPVTVQHLSDAYRTGAIEFEQYKTLTSVLEAHAKELAGGHDSKEYGPEFFNLLPKIAPHDGTPPLTRAQLQDAYVQNAASGRLTASGLNKLLEFQKKGNESHDKEAVNKALTMQMEYAKNKMGDMEDNPGLGVRFKNPKGLALYNGTFGSRYLAGYDQWIQSGKNPLEYTINETTDKLIDEVYPPGQRKADSMFSKHEGDAAKAPEQPGFIARLFGATPAEALPPPPEGIAPDGWKTVMTRRPKMDGQPMAPDKWNGIVTKLIANRNDPAFVASINDHLGDSGITAEDILRTVGGAGVPAGRPAAGALPWPGEPGGPPAPASLAPAAPAPAVARATSGQERIAQPRAAASAPAAAPSGGADSQAPPAPSAHETTADRRKRFESEHAEDVAREATEADRRREEARRDRESGMAASQGAREAVEGSLERRNARPSVAKAMADAEPARREALMTDLEQRIRDQRARQERRDLSPDQRETAAVMGDAYEHELAGLRKAKGGDKAGSAIEDELGALAQREAGLKRSGLKGAVLQAQMKRIEDRRAELEAERKKTD